MLHGGSEIGQVMSQFFLRISTDNGKTFGPIIMLSSNRLRDLRRKVELNAPPSA
jgi:hypothetical protein